MPEVLKCGHCAAELPLTIPGPVRAWGTFRAASRGLVVEPKGATPCRCPRCHWITIFENVVDEVRKVS